MRRLHRGESGYRDMAAFLNGSGENDHPSCGPSICPSEPRLISSSLRSLLCGTDEFGVEGGWRHGDSFGENLDCGRVRRALMYS